MKQGVTWLVVGAVAAVGLAATVDALRGTSDPVAPASPPETGEAPAADASGLHGVLYYTGAEDCVLHGVRLPELDEEAVPRWRNCEFSLSPDRTEVAVRQTTWDRRGVLRAGVPPGSSAVAGRISVRSVTGQSVAIEGTAPAFSRFGNLTFSRDGAIHVADPECLVTKEGALEPCSRVVFGAPMFRRAIRGHPSVPDGPGFVREMRIEEAVWLDADRLVVVLAADIRFVGPFQAVLLVQDPRDIDLVDSGIGAGFSGLDASPRGRYFAVSTSNVPGLRVFDRSGSALTLPPLTEPHAIAWSPGDTWTAVATRAGVHVFNAGRPGSRVRRLPIAAADLAWR